MWWLSDYARVSPRTNGLVRLIQLVGWLGVVGTLVTLYNALKSWTQWGRSFWSRLGDLAIALASLDFVWFVFTAHLLSWNLNF